MTLTAWVMLGVILAVALFFWSLPFWAEPRRAPKHRRPSGDLLLDHSNNDDLEDWPPRWHTLDDVVAELGIDESDDSDDPEHEAWLRSMTDPQTPEDWARSHEGAERLLAAIHEQTLRDGDDYIHGMTDGGAK